MGHHVLGFQANAAQDTETVLTPIADDVLQDQNNGFFSNDRMDLIGVAAYGTDFQYGKIVQPSLNCFGNAFFAAAIAGLTGATGDSNVPLRDDRPLTIKPRELLKLEGSQDNAVAQDITGIAIVRDRFEAAPSGDVITIRGTSTTAATADAWSPITMTWSVDLPAGNYAVVGGRFMAADCFAWRLNAQDCRFRPGGYPVADVQNLSNKKFRFGRLGKWCTFDNNLMPKPEVLCGAATAVHTLYLDIVKIG